MAAGSICVGLAFTVQENFQKGSVDVSIEPETRLLNCEIQIVKDITAVVTEATKRASGALTAYLNLFNI